ncbi:MULTISPECIES: hypothetical protein [Pseudomonas]|uniref:Uncharacterized protein n=1 Tax=Pseudomonas auratipiscis TaxID=3115853 RepID=A0AB35WRJ8_9PSED|nr:MULTISPECIES: hypothetical protein [unclassified Pseudomonas]MEE1866039.1 hypothetical protein [Pseudomonas sp. 120P]MEE1956792.1 hypothetical protein [Pseudomonas sp. 119P]
MMKQSKQSALAQWRQDLQLAYQQLEPEERYDKALKAADTLLDAQMIDSREWRDLVKAANAYLFH